MRTSKYSSFKAALCEHCPNKGLDDWARVGHHVGHNAQVLELGDVLLYVRDSALDAGWWGVTKTVHKALQDSGRPWQLLLLRGDGEEGYLFPIGADVQGSTTNDVSYILHEDQDTAAAVRFNDFEELFSHLGFLKK